MQILYQANDIAEAIIQMLVDTWPHRNQSSGDWQGMLLRIQVARNLVRRIYQQQTYTLDSNLSDILEDLDILHKIVDYISKEIDQRSSTLDAA